MFNEPSPAGVKYAASLLGLCAEETRLPVMPLSAESKATIDSLHHLMG
jgi:4-hydroxy-tetrahydrodipicolinate synthase